MTRGADNTTPVGHSAGFTVRNVVSAAWLQSLDDKVKYATLNVKDYGAQGDNFTNDGPAIQAALDDAWKMGGAQVIVPRGTYRIMSAATSSSPLKVRSNTRLTLQPGAQVHRYSNPNGASLVWSGDFSQLMAGFNGQKNIVVEGGTWDMRASASTGALATDNFTRANTAAPHALGAMTTGQTWIDETSQSDPIVAGAVTTSGNLGIVSNTVFNPTANQAITSVGAWPDGTTQVTVPTTNTTGQTGLVFRLDNANNFWQYTRDGASGNARLSYWVQGVETVVTATNTRAVAAGATLTVTCIGSRIIAGVITSGAYLMSHDTTDPTNSTVASYRKSGLIMTDTTSRLSAFSASASYWADTFTRTNSASSLGTTSSGYAWTARSGTLGINTNLAYAPGSGTNISTVDVSSECNPTVTVTTVGSTLNGLVFRYIDNNNYWYYARNAAGNAELAKVVAGTPTIITPTASTAVANGNVLNVYVIGYEIQCYVGATQTHSVNNDSANYAGTKAGLIINDATARLGAFDTPTSWGGGPVTCGACFSFSHNTNVVFRDLTVLDTHQNSHSIDMQGLQHVLIDNCRFLGCVGSQSRGAIQVDCAVNDGLTPTDGTSTSTLLIRGCTVAQSYSPGTNAYPRAFEAHAGKVTKWYSSIRVTDCHMETTELGVRGYNWKYGVIANNVFLNGWGIDFKTIATANTGDTLGRDGVQTSASQAVLGCSITGNVIDGTGNATAPAAIRVWGETTGHITDVAVTGNTISATSGLGIELQWVDRGTVTGNTIGNTGDRGLYIHNSTDVTATGNTVYSAANHGIGMASCTGGGLIGNTFDTTTGAAAAHGIVIDTCTDVTICGNQSRLAGKHGIYVLAGSRVRLLDNYIYGASRNANNTNASIKCDTSPDDVTISGNTTRAVGSGNDSTYGLHVSTGTNIKRLANDFHTGATADFLVANGDLGYVPNKVGSRLTADVASLTATTYATVAGLTAVVPAVGTYIVRAYLLYSQATLAAANRFSIGGTTSNASTGAPSGTIGGTVVHVISATGSSTSAFNGYLSNTTSATPGATGTVYPVMIEAILVATSTGTLQVQYLTGSASDAITIKSGSFIQIERIG